MKNSFEKVQALWQGFIKNWKGGNYLLKERETERERDGETEKEERETPEKKIMPSKQQHPSFKQQSTAF